MFYMINVEAVKTCPKHGELTKEQCFIRTEKRWGKGVKTSLSCRACKKESSDKYRAKPGIKEKCMERNKEDRKNNKERINKTRKIYKQKNRTAINEYELKRYYKNHERSLNSNIKCHRRWCAELKDSYVKAQLARKYRCKPSEVPEWMIEIKRAIIMLRRKIREIESGNS